MRSDENVAFKRHVRELRQRLVAALIVFAGFSAISFYFSPGVLSWLQADLALSLHALKAYEVIYTQIMISLILGFFLSLPFTLYQFLAFARPGLRPGEYRLLRDFLPFSFLLFLMGAVFAYQFVVKTALEFFQGVTRSSGVEAVWGLKNTVGFALKISALTGVVFQLPVVAVVLAKAGLADAEMMRGYRSHFFVAVLFVAAVATPPDVVTQLLITGPVLGLYQLSIFLVSRIEASVN